ncbi:hypothetical protein NL676_003368 [Syzygium grande]|nr:hypothetical protein NL676_003368 [Syzygium grande]
MNKKLVPSTQETARALLTELKAVPHARVREGGRERGRKDGFRVEEATKRKQQQHKGRECNHPQQNHQQLMQCNKGKASKFKRSSSNLEEDGASSAILLLACIACTPPF